MAALAIIGKILLILLKVIGWTLVGVLGLILIVLLIVLFLPIRYEVKAEGGKTDAGTEVSALAKVHLLLKLIQGTVTFDEGKLSAILRIAWIKKQLVGGEKPKAEEGKNDASSETEIATEKDLAEEIAKEDPEPDTDAETVPTTKPVPEVSIEPTVLAEAEEDEGDILPQIQQKPAMQEEASVPETEPILHEEEPLDEEFVLYYGENGQELHTDLIIPILNKIENFIDGLSEKYENVYNKVSGPLTKVQELKYKAECIYYEVYTYPDREFLLNLLLRQLKKTGRRLRPTRFEIEGRYGLDNPVTTANITTVYGILDAWGPDIKHYRLDLTPDFEEETLEGNVFVKGKLQGYMLVFPVLRLAISPKTWRLIRYILKRKKQIDQTKE